MKLGHGQAAEGGPPVPVGGSGRTLSDRAAEFIFDAQRVAGRRQVLLRRLSEPVNGFFPVPGDSVAEIEHHGQGVLCLGITGLRQRRYFQVIIIDNLLLFAVCGVGKKDQGEAKHRGETDRIRKDCCNGTELFVKE